MSGMWPVSAENTLHKKGLRSDSIWTNNLLYRDALKRMPFNMDVAALDESQYWSREKLDAYAWSKMRAVVSDAQRIPFWKDTFTRFHIDPASFSKQDLTRLPLVSKRDFSFDAVQYWTNGSLLPRSYQDRTSGSTGQPFRFYVDKSFELRSFAICERMLRIAARGDRLPIVALRGRPKLGLAFFKHHLFFLTNYNVVKYRLPALVELTESLNSEIILYGFASAFIELGRRAREAGATLPIRAAISTGESVRPSERAFIEESLQTDFFTNYATRELGWLAFECEERVLHLNEEWAYLETVDDEGNPLPHGAEGKIVTTVFENHVMPLIRYSNGDRGVISDEPCQCGRSLLTITVKGRDIEYIKFGDGRAVSALELVKVFEVFFRDVRQYQVVQIEPRAFLVKIVAGPRFEENREHLERRLVQALHPRARISWEIVEEIPAAQSGKAVYFVSEIR